MGIYENNFICYGTVISNDQYNFLTNHTDKDLKPYTEKCGNKYVLYVPGSYYNFKNRDAMFESHEIEQNYVSLSEVRRCLQSYSLTEDEVSKLLTPDVNEIDSVKLLLNLLNSQDGNNVEDMKLLMGQIQYTTYQGWCGTCGPSVDWNSGILQHTLEVRDI